MAQIAILERKCNGCGVCAQRCPFSAIDMINGRPELNAACKVCGVCIKACEQKAILRLETKVESVDKSQWNGLLVFAEVSGGRLHPVSLELIGKARSLAQGTHHPVKAVVLGETTEGFARELLHYGVDEVFTYEDAALGYFRADAYACCVEDCIRRVRPSVVLVGATALGRSLAPRLATRFHTGLTADCTRLELRENSDLVQIRPAFGGNIIATIVNPDHRPQMATVREGVMRKEYAAQPGAGEVKAIDWKKMVTDADLAVKIIDRQIEERKIDIKGAGIIVAGGYGMGSKENFKLVHELADVLGGEVGASRAAVDAGFTEHARQVGQTGVTVRPKLYIACGISGQIQHTAGMDQSSMVISINSDPEAPINKIADYAITGDVNEIIPKMIKYYKQNSK